MSEREVVLEIVSTGAVDEEFGELHERKKAVVRADGARIIYESRWGNGPWRSEQSMGASLTWPEIRRLAAMDPESPLPRVRAVWERITAYPEWHSDANGETMLVVSDDAMAEMDTALDPGTEGGGE